MRPAHEPAVRTAETPIYDALCAEYRRLFRALPGDRSGEELRFDVLVNRRSALPPGNPPPGHRARDSRPGQDRGH